jgi:hypothetical protein
MWERKVVKQRVPDDRVIGAALVAVLDECQWPQTGELELIKQADVIKEIDGGEW